MQRTGKSILFVDDDIDTRQMMSIFLEHSGYEVTTTGTVAEAMRLAERGAFDIYILDNLLPDGTGIELCREFQKLYPHVPILFFSGAAYDSNIEEAMDAGAGEYLIKPSGMAKLEASIERLLMKGSREASKVQAADMSSIAPSLMDESKRLARRTDRRNP